MEDVATASYIFEGLSFDNVNKLSASSPDLKKATVADTAALTAGGFIMTAQ